MNLPLEQLYNYLDSVCNDNVLIYRWKVNGSRKLDDCTMLRSVPDAWFASMTKPHMIFHDQEPLNFDFYQNQDLIQYLKTNVPDFYRHHEPVLNQLIQEQHPVNLKILCRPYTGGLHDRVILCHSELNSPEVEKYTQAGFVGVYYWANALVARDWYRYAEIDPLLTFKFPQKPFLFYSRAWSGTREYRLKFAEKIITGSLASECHVKFRFTDNQHYSLHQFKNSKFKLDQNNFENYFLNNNSASHSSASYDANDYQIAGIDIVAETLFDDQRNHLTEKIFRPIACGKPFILLSTPYSLQYLKKYGFKTFDQFWDESYDSILDPIERMDAVIKTMQTIAGKSRLDQELMYKSCHDICEHNRRRFFSDDFFKTIIDEFKQNFYQAYQLARQSCTGKNYLQFRRICDTDPSVSEYIKNNTHYSEADLTRLFDFLANEKPA